MTNEEELEFGIGNAIDDRWFYPDEVLREMKKEGE